METNEPNSNGADEPNPVPSTDSSIENILENPLEEPDATPTIDSLQNDLEEANKRILIAQADLENFRRRTRRDLQDQLRYAPMNMMSELLESVDNLNRALDAYESDPNGQGLVEGVKMVGEQISTTLSKHGCEKIEAIGQPFDPNLHQALQMQPSVEFSENVVSAELRSGFQLHDRVIRPSQVFVSTGPEN